MQNDTIIHIDLSYLYTVSGGDRQFEKLLLTGAVSDIESQVNALEQAWVQQDAGIVRSAAHSLKSVTAIAGLPQLESSCKMIDSLFADGIFHAEAESTCYDIIHGWQAAKPQLEHLISTY